MCITSKNFKAIQNGQRDLTVKYTENGVKYSESGNKKDNFT
jgi:hypothetical protein